MAKLLDRIRRANAGEGVRIGFGTSASKPVPPRLAVIARVPATDADSLRTVIETGVDALLVSGVPTRADLESALGGSDKCVVGLVLDDTLPETLSDLIEGGLDFLLLSSTRLPLWVLRQETLAIGLDVPAGLDDNRLRSLAGAPGAFAVTPLAGGSQPMVEDLIEVRRIALFLNRPIFVETVADLSTDDLAALRDNGLGAIIVTESDTARLQALRERLNELPAPVKPAGERATAVLPAGSLSRDGD